MLTVGLERVDFTVSQGLFPPNGHVFQMIPDRPFTDAENLSDFPLRLSLSLQNPCFKHTRSLVYGTCLW